MYFFYQFTQNKWYFLSCLCNIEKNIPCIKIRLSHLCCLHVRDSECKTITKTTHVCSASQLSLSLFIT